MFINGKSNFRKLEISSDTPERFFEHHRVPPVNPFFKINAYNKKSLGTIPSVVSTILFYDPRVEERKGFNSQSLRFKRESGIKFLLNPEENEPPSPAVRKEKNTKKKNDKLVNKSTNTNTLNDPYSMYYPGPADYHPNVSFGKRGNFRYQSLFTYGKDGRNKRNNPMVGPGSYDLISGLKHLSYAKNGNSYMSSVPRKGEGFTEGSTSKIPGVGPGTYNIIKLQKRGGPSPFFMKSIPKRENLEDKYITKNYDELQTKTMLSNREEQKATTDRYLQTSSREYSTSKGNTFAKERGYLYKSMDSSVKTTQAQNAPFEAVITSTH